MAGYSEIVLLHAESPRNAGWLEDANAIGVVGNTGRPPFMAIYLRIEDSRVVAARYRTFGCGPAIAAGSVLTEMMVGRTVAECGALDHEDLAEALGGLPRDKGWCAGLAIDAMQKALEGHEAADAEVPQETSAGEETSKTNDNKE